MPDQIPSELNKDLPIKRYQFLSRPTLRRNLFLFILLPLLGLFLLAALGGKFLLAPTESRPMAILPQPTGQPISPTLIVTPTVQPIEEKLLFSRTLTGGMCPEGTCESLVVMTAEGEIKENQVTKGIVTATELSRLANLIADTCCSELKVKKFTGTCPIAYDGQEVIYRFYTLNGIEEVRGCEYVIDPNHALIAYINSLFKKYKIQ